MLKADGFQSTAEIGSRLAELEQEKKQLLTQISPNSALFKEQEVIENRPPWEMTAKAKPLLPAFICTQY